ncbi:Carboxypeptidase regulatory-like domain-containing protein [Ralstonia mannitolilytica]|nr:hypothetical protein R77555_02513 [Ralstonia mannitolilytica]
MWRYLAGAFLVTASQLAMAAEADLTRVPEIRHQNEIAYLSGGIGRDERDAMRSVARQFNVRLNVVTLKTGEALSDVDVSVVDSHGKLRLRVRTEGPLLYMRLPHGRYQVTPAYIGAMQTLSIQVNSQPVDAVVRLHVEPGVEPWLLCRGGCPRNRAHPATPR